MDAHNHSLFVLEHINHRANLGLAFRKFKLFQHSTVNNIQSVQKLYGEFHKTKKYKAKFTSYSHTAFFKSDLETESHEKDTLLQDAPSFHF